MEFNKKIVFPMRSSELMADVVLVASNGPGGPGSVSVSVQFKPKFRRHNSFLITFHAALFVSWNALIAGYA